jgi:hypothetical protein
MRPRTVPLTRLLHSRTQVQLGNEEELTSDLFSGLAFPLT